MVERLKFSPSTETPPVRLPFEWEQSSYTASPMESSSVETTDFSPSLYKFTPSSERLDRISRRRGLLRPLNRLLHKKSPRI